MKNTFPFLFLFGILSICLTFNTLYAQGGPGRGNSTGDRPSIGILKGKLIDEMTGNPIEYGSIALMSKRDSSLAGGTISDPKGNFRIEQVKVGKYFIRIQFIGYETQIINDIVIRPDSPEVNLGSVKLHNRATSIGGVEITAEKEMLVNNLDKKIINVDKSIAAVGGNAVDVMQSIPSVTVDVDGNVSLRGSSNVTILIDGKPSGLSDISSGDLLQQIPASSIESVEVITNPSVRYDPEGTSGIINIVLKKKSLQGFNGMISATAGTGDRYNGSINLNVRRNRINLFAGFDSRIGRFNSTGETNRLTTYDSINTRLVQSQEMNNERHSYNLNTGLDFLIDNSNTLTLSFQYRKMDYGNEGDILSRTFDSNDNSVIRSFNRFSNSVRDIESFTYNAAYKRTFDVKGRELTIDMMVNDNNMVGSQEISQTELPYLPEQPLTLQNAISGNVNMMYMVQSNFTTPLGKSGRLETGFKSTIRNMSMKNSMQEYNNNEWIEDSISKNEFDYFEQIHAVYGIYSSSYRKLKYQVGLRFEQLISNSELKLNEEKFDRSYPDLYPSVHLIYEQSTKHQFILSYSRRVSRPNPRQLNPFVDYSDSLNIRFGNPRLDPEFIDSYELGWSGFWGKNSLNATTFYRYTSGIIENIVSLQENGVTATTFENLTSGTNYGIELIGNREFSSWFKANANFSFFRQLINGSEMTGLERVEGNMWTAKVNLTFNILKNATLLIAGNYESPEIEAQDREEEVYFADVALKYDFLKNKATISLRVSDVFDTRRHNSETKGESFFITSKRRMDTRVGYIGFSYKINNYNRQRERDRNGQGEMEMEEF